MSAYATLTEYVQEFGLEETSQLLRDEESELLTPELLREGVAGEYAPDRTDDERATCDRAMGRLTSMLVQSSRFMDGYLRANVRLPLDQADIDQTPLKTCCLSLTRCSLQDDPDNATEQQEKRCKYWNDWLRDVSAGKVRLLPPPAASGRRVLWGKVPSAYNWDRYGK
ncbi:phage protein Gp36 family protein [Burkholderia cepacia]|uniref:phage protein Gp36 family protein n=1 Tax=Burkholderia cepacia TaxID=292 RepID=UPI003EE3CC46